MSVFGCRGYAGVNTNHRKTVFEFCFNDLGLSPGLSSGRGFLNIGAGGLCLSSLILRQQAGGADPQSCGGGNRRFRGT